MVAEAVAVQTEFVREGVVYRCGDSIAVRLTPKRKNRWQVTVYQGEVPLDTIVLDPADKAQREKVVRGLTLEAVEADELRHLFDDPQVLVQDHEVVRVPDHHRLPGLVTLQLLGVWGADRLLEAVQRDVGEQRRDDPALRRPHHRGLSMPLLHHPGS